MEPQPVEKLILPALQSWPGLSKLVGEKIYAEAIPAGIKLPALTYSVSETPNMRLSGYQDSMVGLTIDVWAQGVSDAEGVALEVQKAMGAAPVVKWFVRRHRMPFENHYRITLEYTCQQKGGFEND